MIRKSDDQREREARGATDREARREVAEAAKADRRQVTLYEGAPFGQSADIDTADVDDFAPPAPEPPFKLSGDLRQAIFDGGHPRITFPKPEACPISVGEVYEVSSQVSFVVTGISELKTEWEIHYQVLDHRAHLLGKALDYSSSAQGAIATRKEREDQPMGGPQFRAEVEPEAVDRSDQRQISDDAREDRLAVLRESKAKIEEAIGAMENDPAMSRHSSELQHWRKRLQRLTRDVERGEAMAKEAA